MKVALCTRRKLPPGRRQDGFNPLPPEATHDLVVEVEISGDPETEVVEYQDRFFIYSEMKYSGLDLFVEVKHEKAANNKQNNDACSVVEKVVIGLSSPEEGRQLRSSVRACLKELDNNEIKEGVRDHCRKMLNESFRLAQGVGSGKISPNIEAGSRGV